MFSLIPYYSAKTLNLKPLIIQHHNVGTEGGLDSVLLC